MKLSLRTISDLAELICGGNGSMGGFHWKNFPYRSGSQLTQFFISCNLHYEHDGSTRKSWVEKVLSELNQGLVTSQSLPPESIIIVIQELMDIVDYHKNNLSREDALQDLNNILIRDNIEAYFDTSGKCYIRNIETSITSSVYKIQSRPFSPIEIHKRNEISDFLDRASEDEFIEEFLVPLFRHLGFLRVTPTGHHDKSLEYGKDLWMKYQLPTGHFIYFAAQVKKEKIDAAGKNLNNNISGILAQVRMALDHPIFDPETNRNILIDHIYIISANVITKQAKNLLNHHLDSAARRHIIFMDREELLDLGAIHGINVSNKEIINRDYLDVDDFNF
jgi:hypothetical protein